MSDSICCAHHDVLFSDGTECGEAGMGTPVVCCKRCPEYKYLVDESGVTPELYQPEGGEDDRQNTHGN